MLNRCLEPTLIINKVIAIMSKDKKSRPKFDKFIDGCSASVVYTIGFSMAIGFIGFGPKGGSSGLFCNDYYCAITYSDFFVSNYNLALVAFLAVFFFIVGYIYGFSQVFRLLKLEKLFKSESDN